MAGDSDGIHTKQFVVTVAAGKRLIARGMAAHPAVRAVLAKGTLVIVAGTTNGYVAEEVLRAAGQAEGFDRAGFRRGATTPPGTPPPEAAPARDVVLIDGVWQRDKTIFDVAGDLKAGDVVLKGANALDVRRGHAGVLVEHPVGGTIAATIPTVIGRRVRLIVPVGLEKRVLGNITDLAGELNAPGVDGPRMMPLPGEVFTELDAIALLTGAAARMVAGGGVCGAEGAVWIAVTGEADQLQAATELIASVAAEPPFQA